ncbi:Cysteine-rich secretory protein family protein [Lachnospiraceae bacterium]|nr:Cysteine-rich secretory protein family protein [Lachnospiraceae bacterium]
MKRISYISKKIFTTVIISFLISLFFTSVLNVSAADNTTADIDTARIQYSQYTKAGNDSIEVMVLGSYMNDQKKALDRMNELRREACYYGFPDPRDPSRSLTTSDYVPIKWSKGLEEYARFRSAEGLIEHGHTRPGTNVPISDQYKDNNGGYVTGNGESLCWPGKTLKGGVDEWYIEKTFWLNGNAELSGHYTAIINPDFVYVGVGGFNSPDYSLEYSGCVCGIFAEKGYMENLRYSSDEVRESVLNRLYDESYLPDCNNVFQVISIKKELLGNPEIIFYNKTYDRDYNNFYLGESGRLRVSRKYKSRTNESNVFDLDNYSFKAVKTSVAKVTSQGLIETKNTGSVAVTAVNGSGNIVKSNVIVKPFLKTPKIKKLKKAKKSITVKFSGSSSDFDSTKYYEIQIAENKKFTKKVKTKTVLALYNWDSSPRINNEVLFSKLKKKKTYYVRVRAVSKVVISISNNKSYNNNYTLYSGWTKPKKIKTK